MKRILTLLLFCAFSVLGFAQTSFSSGNPSVEMNLKRTVAQGGNVIMDFIVTCHIEAEGISFRDPEIYDDEGNLYTGRNAQNSVYNSFTIDGKTTYLDAYLKLERDIPRKMRLTIQYVDEYASSFLLVKIPYYLNGTQYTVVIKNLPISRQ
jgi:hypothetical protein